MSEESVSDKIRRMSLLKPEFRDDLSRPQVKSITCEIEMRRETAEKMFKSLVFEPGEDSVTITEVLRPALPGEPQVFFHSGAGVGFCVDRYELDGVIL